MGCLCPSQGGGVKDSEWRASCLSRLRWRPVEGRKPGWLLLELRRNTQLLGPGLRRSPSELLWWLWATLELLDRLWSTSKLWWKSVGKSSEGNPAWCLLLGLCLGHGSESKLDLGSWSCSWRAWGRGLWSGWLRGDWPGLLLASDWGWPWKTRNWWRLW